MAPQDGFKKDDSGQNNSGQNNSDWGRLAAGGMEIAAGAGLGAVLGTWIDRRWHCDPWGVLIGTVLGISAGMYLLIKEAIKANKN